MKTQLTKNQLITKIITSYKSFHDYITGIAENKLLEIHNAKGWNSRDFMIHLARWEMGIVYLLQNKQRAEGMGIPQELVDNWDLEQINNDIQKKNKDIGIGDALHELDLAHQAMLVTLESLDEADLYRPYNYYAKDLPFTEPVIQWIIGNTFKHFEEHLKTVQNLINSE